MMENDKINISVQALNWTGGECAFFEILILRNAEVRVDWKDGHSTLISGNGDWQRVEHRYSDKHQSAETIFSICLEASAANVIIGLKHWSIDMHTTEVDVSGCPSLIYLNAEYSVRLNISMCTQLETLDITGCRFEEINLSKNIHLKELVCRSSKLSTLKLSTCNELERLDVACCFKLKQISISNDSKLIYADITGNPLTEKCLHYLVQTIKRNNGVLINE